MHYESYVKHGMPSLASAHCHQCPYSRPKRIIVSYAWQSSRVCTKAHQEQAPSSYHLLQLSADSSVICSAICSVFRHLHCIILHGHFEPLCRVYLPCQGPKSIHDSIPRPIDRGIEGYVIDDRPSQDRCPHLSRGDRGNCLTHK